MSNYISYDFEITSCIAVEAPAGTDPNTLIDRAITKLIARAIDRDVELQFANTFDPETGAYCVDWEIEDE